MSSLEFYWGQPHVGGDVYLSDPSIGGPGLMQSASRVRGTRSRAHTRGRVTSKTKRPHSLPSLALRRDSPLGDRTAAVDGKLQGESLRFLQPAEFFYQGHSHSVL